MHCLLFLLVLHSLISLRMYLLQLFTAFVLQAGVAVATSFNDTTPTVKLDSATFVGFTNGSVARFLGIPFAKPP
jgi:acetylcholinesterase